MKTSIREDGDYIIMLDVITELLKRCADHWEEAIYLDENDETRQLMLEIHNANIYVQNHQAIVESFVEREERKRAHAPRQATDSD